MCPPPPTPPPPRNTDACRLSRYRLAYSSCSVTHRWLDCCRRTHLDTEDQGESAESAGESDADGETGGAGVIKKSKAVDRSSKLTKSERNKQALKKERAREHAAAVAAKTMRKEVCGASPLRSLCLCAFVDSHAVGETMTGSAPWKQLNMLGHLQKEISVEEKRREVERLRYGYIRSP